MQKLRGIRNTGAYTAQRGVAERLLLIEWEMEKDEQMRGMEEWLFFRNMPERMKTIHEKVQGQLINSNILHIDHYAFQQYLYSSIEQSPRRSFIRGLYTSEICNYLSDEQPFEIDLNNQTCHMLFYLLNNKTTISIKNLAGNENFMYAGAHGKKAHVNIQNLSGDKNFVSAGTEHGIINLVAKNVVGKSNFQNLGIGGGGTMVGQDISGIENVLFGRRTQVVIYNSTPTIRIEGICYASTRENICKLIEQNPSPEEVMAYLRRCT